MPDKPEFEEEIQVNTSFGDVDAALVFTRRIDYTKGEISIKVGPGFVYDKTVVLKGGVEMLRSDAWIQESAEFLSASLAKLLKKNLR